MIVMSKHVLCAYNLGKGMPIFWVTACPTFNLKMLTYLSQGQAASFLHMYE